jgi:hypothetical protein
MFVGVEHYFIDDGRPVSRGKRVVRACLALSLCVIVVGVAASYAWDAVELRRRPVAPCTVVESIVDTVGASTDRYRPYRLRVALRFHFAGRDVVAHQGAADEVGSEDAAEVYAEADRLRPGVTTTCWVDTTHPEISILTRPWSAGELLALPGCVAGAAILLGLYCIPQLRLAWAGDTSPAMPGSRRQRRAGLMAGAGLAGGFGSLTLAWWGIPLGRTVGSMAWPAVPCVVEQSHVQTMDRGGGDLPVATYRTDILYRYTVAGHAYHSNRYSLTESAAPGSGPRARVAARYPSGRPATCYVDPADPRSAVLARHVSPTAAFGLVPLAMTLLGLLVLVVRADDTWANRLLRRSKWTLLGIAITAIGLMGCGLFVEP